MGSVVNVIKFPACDRMTEVSSNSSQLLDEMEHSITFQLRNVPEFLQGSAFFQTLNTDDEEGITLPVSVFKQDIAVNTNEEAIHLLSTLQFWGSDVVPDDIIKFVLVGLTVEMRIMLEQFNEHFPLIDFLRKINEGDDAQRVNLVLSKGNIGIVKIVVENSPRWDRENACKHAAESGNLECLEYIHKLGGTLDRAVCVAAARGGYIDCFDYAHSNGVLLDPIFTCCAVESGHLAMLTYLQCRSCPWDPFTTRCAAEHNQLECLRFAHENGCPWSPETVTGAAASGQLEILKFLHAQGCPWDTQAPQNAAYHGQLECLRFLYEHQCPWNSNVAAYAALRGHMDCLKFLHEHGCPWGDMTTAMAAERNNLAMLKYAAERGCSVAPGVYRWAARYRNIEMMQLAHSHHADWTYVQRETIIESAKSGSLECLKFAHECGCPIESFDAVLAAVGGHLSCLEYILTNMAVPAGVKIKTLTADVTCAAAEYGHLECLVYAHTFGCKWNKSTCEKAARKGHIDCLKYAVENGCTVNEQECLAAARRGNHTECENFINSLREDSVTHRTQTCCFVS